MAKFNQNIETNIKDYNYDVACTLYELSLNATTNIIGSPNSKIININFKADGIGCIVNSYDEFVDVAYGQNIQINVMSLSFGDLFFSIRKGKTGEQQVIISVYCENKLLLSKIVAEIRKHIPEPMQDTAIESVAIPQTIPAANSDKSNITINVGGNLNMEGSAIGDGNSTTSTKQEIKKEVIQKSSFWSGIWQNLVSNIIWLILGAVILSILSYLGLRE